MADKIIPDDLRNKPSDQKTNDYFLVTVNDLNPSQLYSFQFAWVYEDKTVSPWSSTFSARTRDENELNKPKFLETDLSYLQGVITVQWGGKDYLDKDYLPSLDRIDVYVRDDTSLLNPFILKGSFKSSGKINIAVEPATYSVYLKAVNKSGITSDASDVRSTIAKALPPSVPSNLVPAWEGTTFTLSFDHDTNNAVNKNLKEYILTLKGSPSNQEWPYTITPAPGINQKFTLNMEQNGADFGQPELTFSGSLYAKDKDLNRSNTVTFSNTTYVSSLIAPIISATNAVDGYSVAYTAQTSPIFNFILIEEVESNSSTAPTTGYSSSARGNSNPLFVPAENNNTRWVRAKLYDKLGGSHLGYSNVVVVTPKSAVTSDFEGPPDVTSVTTTAGIDTSGYLGFNGYIDVSWPSIIVEGIRGYRIRFSNDGGTTYSYVDSPGTVSPAGTIITYRLGGLAIGSTYKIAVATYDEYNNLSTGYISTADRLIPGTPSMSNYISAGNMKLGYGVNASSDKGLYLDSSNYWYLNATNSARLNIGGSTNNYLNWDGAEFEIDGNLIAQKGTFKGNVEIQSGGTLYSGNVFTGGAGYRLDYDGLSFNSSTSVGITEISGTTGKLKTNNADIGGWLIDSAQYPNSIYKVSGTNIIKIDSANASFSVTGTTYTAGFGIPDGNNIVFWAGTSRSTSAPFYVTTNGSVVLKNAEIAGTSTFGGKNAADLVSSLQLTDGTTVISGSNILSGTIDLNNGATIRSKSSGSRLEITSSGLKGYAVNGTTKVVEFDTSTGKLYIGSADVSSGVADIDLNNVTTIDGGKITTGLIKSVSYDPGTGYFAADGFGIDLANKTIRSKKFSIDNQGNAYFAGTISADTQIISPIITGGTLKTAENVGSGTSGVLIDADGIKIYNSNTLLLKLSSDGFIAGTQFGIDATGNASFSGTITSGTLITSPKITGGEFATESTSGNTMLIKENDIKFFTSGVSFGGLYITNNSVRLSNGVLADERAGVAFAASGLASLYSPNGRLDLGSSGSVLSYGNNRITLDNSNASVTNASVDSTPSLRNIFFTQSNNTATYTGGIGSIALVFA